jgi:hypothetical protein
MSFCPTLLEQYDVARIDNQNLVKKTLDVWHFRRAVVLFY